LREQDERLLPAQRAGFRRDLRRNALLHDVDRGAAEHLREADRRAHFARQVRIVEAVGVHDAQAGHEFEVLTAEGVARPRRVVGERHPVRAADARVEVVDLAGEAVRRQPLGHRVGVEERPVDAVGRGAQDAVKADGSGHRRCSFVAGGFPRLRRTGHVRIDIDRQRDGRPTSCSWLLPPA